MGKKVVKGGSSLGIILDDQNGNDKKLTDISDFILEVGKLADKYGYDVQSWTYNNPFCFTTVHESNALLALRNLKENLDKI